MSEEEMENEEEKIEDEEEYVPRRLRRFHRETFTPTEEEVKSKGTELAITEVDKFKKMHERYPQKEELNEISQNVFEQLKTDLSEKKEETKKIEDSIEFGFEEEQLDIGDKKSFLDERKAKRAKNRKIKNDSIEKETNEEKLIEPTEQINNPPIKENPISEIKSLLTEDSENIENTKNIKQLAEIDELGNLETELSEENDFDLIDKETEGTPNNCAFCNNKAKEIIYCPNCGQAFCDHCAKTIDVQNDFVKYTCPKCGKEFKKRKNI